MDKGYKGAIEELALENEHFRRVLYTAMHCQLVLMSLLPGQEIGTEVHRGGDQFFRFESGTGTVIINKTEYAVSGGDAVIVPMGAHHNIINSSLTKPLKMYTLYAPPHHRDGVVHHAKANAAAAYEHFDGETTEV
jgi:mannose-6-phosphate isomerase-like protein (cupin superfamily)